jgi:hypothetical protein
MASNFQYPETFNFLTFHMRLNLLLLFIYFSSGAVAQNGTWKFYGPGDVRHSIATTDSAIVMVGSDFSVLKVRLNGDTIWTRKFPDWTGPSAINSAVTVCETPEGDYLIGGYTGNLSTFIPRIIKIDPAGNFIWARIFSTGYVQSLLVNSRGLYMATINERSGAGADVYLYELDSAGNTIWNKTFYSDASLISFTTTDIKLTTGDALVLSAVFSLSGNVSSLIMNLDSAGQVTDSTVYTDQAYGSNLLSFDLANDSIIYTCGAHFDAPVSGRSCRVMKLRSNGDTITTRTLPYQFSGQMLRFDPQLNNIIIAGYGYDSSLSNSTVYICMLDTSLTVQSIYALDTGIQNSTFSFVTINNRIYVSGSSDNATTPATQWLYIDSVIITNVISVYSKNIIAYYSDSRIYFPSLSDPFNINIYTASGALVDTKFLNDDRRNVDVSRLKFGFYIAVIHYSDNSYQVLKFIR